MSKTIHLICNAHLDPVWQWEWEEGAAEALSTFRIAADFCEEFDDFVFCHNEALLYEWVEEYDPELFGRIQELVKQGKWHIMGGWYIQPDCNMPSGEAFIRQILAGRKYFEEKFGTAPSVAVNVDPFGHSRGLVQIMKKFGYDGYLFMRPGNEYISLPDEFKWVGYDGSEITAVKLKYSYNSKKGFVDEKIKLFTEICGEDDIELCLWGVGNHGGGPSKTDLCKIEELKKQLKDEGFTLIHSTPEKYFREAEKKHSFEKIETSLTPWAVGCYTTQVRIKQKYRFAENTYFLTESMCAVAEMSGLMSYPADELNRAMKAILTVQFHDMLPGTSIKDGEELSLRKLNYALEILSNLKAKAFFALSSGQRKADEDKIPFFAYNPYPYPLSGDFSVEFNLWDQIWDDVFMKPTVYDGNGEICPSQCEKERSTIPLQWRKRVTFNATLKPMQLNRFDCAFEAVKAKETPDVKSNDEYYLFDNLRINKNTGLVDGENYFENGAFSLEVFEDNFDPWYMDETSWKNKDGEFRLLDKKKAAEFCCIENEIEPVHIIENGDVRTVIEAVFGYGESYAVVNYIISHDGTLELKIRLLWNEKQKLVKLNVPCSLKNCDCIGEQPYGAEKLKTGFEENVSQKYIILSSDENAICIANKGSYGSSFDSGDLKITLLRSPSYCAHPIGGRKTMPQDRFSQHIDIGEREFSFKVFAGAKEKILNEAPRKALEYNMEPMLLSFYPTGKGEIPNEAFRLEDTEIIAFTALLNENGVRKIRLFNPTESRQTATLKNGENKIELCFGKYEIKTVEYKDKKFREVLM